MLAAGRRSALLFTLLHWSLEALDGCEGKALGFSCALCVQIADSFADCIIYL